MRRPTVQGLLLIERELRTTAKETEKSKEKINKANSRIYFKHSLALSLTPISLSTRSVVAYL